MSDRTHAALFCQTGPLKRGGCYWRCNQPCVTKSPSRGTCASQGKVIPSHMKGPTNDVNNYRPISLLSVFSKILEKLMVARSTTYLELQKIIYPNQFGFIHGYSISLSLLSITETIKTTLDNNKCGCGVFIGLREAFDTVNHEILLQKLEHYGLT